MLYLVKFPIKNILLPYRCLFKVVRYSKLYEDFNEFVKSVREAHLRKENEDRDHKIAMDSEKAKKIE